jgi:hypothetical protein
MGDRTIKLAQSLIAAAIAVALPVSAGAVTLRIVDQNTGAKQSVQAAGTVAFDGTVGNFQLTAASGGITLDPNSYTLDSTAVTASGAGHLRITVIQGGLSDFAGLLTRLEGTAAIADATQKIKVKHLFKADGGWVNVGNALNFYDAGGDEQSKTAFATLPSEGAKFKLRTVINIFGSGGDGAANVSTSLMASAPISSFAPPVPSVPVPAAGLLLLGALGGLGMAARRRRKT